MKLGYWLLLSILHCSAYAKEIITIASGEYPPWSGKELPYEGYVSHLVRSAYAQQGIGVEYKYMPWIRSLEDASNGHYGVSTFWYCTQERQLDFYCSQQAIVAEEVSIYHLTDTNLGEWNSYKDLIGFRFGLTRGYAYDDEFLRAVDQGILSAEFVGSDLQNMRKLLAGRIDLFVMGKLSGNDILNQHFSAQERAKVTMTSKPLFTSNFHVLFSKAHPRAKYWQKQFDAGMTKLKASERFNELKTWFESGKYNKQND